MTEEARSLYRTLLGGQVPDGPFVYKHTGATIMVPRSLLEDAGLLKPMRHTARMWPELVLFPRVEQATSALIRCRDETFRRFSLARIALTDPDALEGDDEW